MGVRRVIRLGNPILRLKSQPVPLTEIRSDEIRNLVRDMFDTTRRLHGQGLAAPQIGVLKQVVVVQPDRVLINPSIKVLRAPLQGNWEGCLSIPAMSGFVERSSRIRMTWYDEKEAFHDEVIEGLDAVVYQHECDHLQGVLYVDRLKSSLLFGFNEERLSAR